MLLRWLAWVVMFHFILLGVAFGEAASADTSAAPAWAIVRAAPVRVMPPLVTPQPRPLDGALYAAIAGYRTLDYLSTRQVLRAGGHESELPQWLVGSPAAFITFEAMATVAEVGSSVWLIRHGHRRMARTLNVVSVGLGGATVAHNYAQPAGFVR